MIKKFLLYLLLDDHGWDTEMAITGVGAIDAVIPNFFAKGIMVDGTNESFWGQLSGKEGSRMPVIDKTGPLANAGDFLTFSTLGQLMGTGVTGENVLKGKEEVIGVGTFSVSCDVVRHAVAVSRKSTKQANFNEIQRVKSLLTEWMTRKRDNDVFTEVIDNASDTLFANGAASASVLRENGGHEFGVTEIELIRLGLRRQGAMPIQMKKVNGRTEGVYGIAFGEIEQYRLYQNSAFVQTIRETWARFSEGRSHPLINSAVGMYRNILLYNYSSLLQIPQGTPLRPETTVYATLTTTATHLSVGGATPATGVKPDYTLFFATAGSLQIADEVLSYTGKNPNAFTGLSRGQAKYVGGDTSTAIQHAENALITQRNISTIIGFGAEAIFRATGDSPEPIGQKDDYTEQNGLGVRAYYGQRLKRDQRRNKTANVLTMKVWSKNPGNI